MTALNNKVERLIFTAAPESTVNFALEILPLTAMSTFSEEVVFDTAKNASGFVGYGAISEITVSKEKWDRVFFFDSDDSDPFSMYPGSFTDASYGILGSDGINPFASPNPLNVSFSESKVIAGWANSNVSYQGNTTLKQDYIRYTAKSITNGYALADLFSNEDDLLKGVTNMDILFNNGLYTALNNVSQTRTLTSDAIKTTESLVTGLLNMAKYPTGSSSNSRGNQFLSDLASQSQTPTPSKRFWVKFHPGDALALQLTYIPKEGDNQIAKNNNDFLGTNRIRNRTYKIYLKMV
jgi:hypothetical protein